LHEEHARADLVVHNAGHWEFGVDEAGKANLHATNVSGTDHVLVLGLELGTPRTVFVSSVQAFGDSGPQPRDETFTRQAPCRTTDEQTKTAAHELARGYQHKGLPLIIVCPHSVIGPNDHGIWEYVLRLYLNHAMPPMSWSPDAIQSAVYIDDLVACKKRPTSLGLSAPLAQREHATLASKMPSHRAHPGRDSHREPASSQLVCGPGAK